MPLVRYRPTNGLFPKVDSTVRMHCGETVFISGILQIICSTNHATRMPHVVQSSTTSTRISYKSATTVFLPRCFPPAPSRIEIEEQAGDFKSTTLSSLYEKEYWTHYEAVPNNNKQHRRMYGCVTGYGFSFMQLSISRLVKSFRSRQAKELKKYTTTVS